MRTDFALVLTAALLLDTFWVRFVILVFLVARLVLCGGVVRVRGAAAQRAGGESSSA